MSETQCKACEQEHLGQRCPAVEAEIDERRTGDWTFIASEYRKWRLRGRKPSEIDYDLCHVFR